MLFFPCNKCQCILRMCSTIMNLLSLANEDSVPGADDFVPVLVFVLIKVGLLIVSDSSCGLLSRVIDRFKSLEGAYFQTV